MNKSAKKLLDDYAAYRVDACKDSSIVFELTTARQVLNFLRDEKKLAADTKFKYRTKKPRKTKRRYCPRLKEARAILQVLQCDPKLGWLFNAVTMLFNTGLRLDEIAQMTSHDISLELGVIWALDEEEEDDSNKNTKSGESRFLAITPELRPVLEKLVTADDKALFVGPRGGYLRSDTVNNNLRSKVLIPLKDRFPHAKFQSITAHCLRHFFLTHATYCGISKTEIDDWMGHGKSSLSQRYFHSNVESACQSIQKFEPILAPSQGCTTEVAEKHT